MSEMEFFILLSMWISIQNFGCVCLRPPKKSPDTTKNTMQLSVDNHKSIAKTKPLYVYIYIYSKYGQPKLGRTTRNWNIVIRWTMINFLKTI